MISRARWTIEFLKDHTKDVSQQSRNPIMMFFWAKTKQLIFASIFRTTTMEIKICGTNFEPYGGKSNLPWTEVVLVNKDGGVIMCSDVRDNVFGEWELEDDNRNRYIVNVIDGRKKERTNNKAVDKTAIDYDKK